MGLFTKLKHRLSRHGDVKPDTDPVTAYNLWSESYDAQPGNLMLDLDEQMLSDLLTDVSLKDKTVVDIGCGTGRHWNRILSQKPSALIGYDVSVGMLNKLKAKFPAAKTYLALDNSLTELENESCDIIISTLTIAHIEHLKDAFLEWHRVLKKGGRIIFTDYHPEALIKGGNRTFAYKGRIVAVKNYTHNIDELLDIMITMNFESVSFTEKKIDASMKHYYEEKKALHVYDNFVNVPIIYGMHLKKKNGLT